MTRDQIYWVLCVLFVVLFDSTQGSASSGETSPQRLKRSHIYLTQQQETIQQEEDEQTILDEQQVEQQELLPEMDNSTRAGADITMPDCGLGRFTAEEIERIVGGRPASSGQFPWQVYLRIVTPGGEMLCGGSILNPRWILTAAHCISSEQTGQYMASAVEVVAGTLDRFSAQSNRQSRYADCALKHPGWTGVRGGFANDIALIRLPANNPLNVNGVNVRGICLPPKTNPPFDYSGVARVAGWGLTRDRGSPSRTLQYTDVSIITDSQCRRYQYPVNIIDSMVCQGVDTSSPCQGDSGGPLIIRNSNKYVQFGLVSFGPGICNNGRIPNAVYTQVSYHMTWIENTIRSYENNPSCQPRRIAID